MALAELGVDIRSAFCAMNFSIGSPSLQLASN
jgi:hypothetical protein